jgi:hypothetical protein
MQPMTRPGAACQVQPVRDCGALGREPTPEELAAEL